MLPSRSCRLKCASRTHPTPTIDFVLMKEMLMPSHQRTCSVNMLRLLAGVYVSRGLDMHLLLFHEVAQADPVNVDTKDDDRGCHGDGGHGASDDTSAPAVVTIIPTNSSSDCPFGGAPARAKGFNPIRAKDRKTRQSLTLEGRGTEGSFRALSSLPGDIDGGVVGVHEGQLTAATTGRNGRFATAGRVLEFRMVLKDSAAHASRMRVRHFSRQ